MKAVPNDKGFFSIVLLTACDSNYTFTAVDISSYGSNNDSSVLNSSRFGEAIAAGNFGIPDPEVINGVSDSLCPTTLCKTTHLPLNRGCNVHIQTKI